MSWSPSLQEEMVLWPAGLLVARQRHRGENRSAIRAEKHVLESREKPQSNRSNLRFIADSFFLRFGIC